ncbi:MAG: hypothetical protein HXX09_10100 [Bacteroidetes bacterium]|nr:hypothetical protein [Bacteroidota bacterium]
MFPLFSYSQQRTDAQELLNSINKTPEYISSAMTHQFPFSSANLGYSKEEIAKAKIKSISICLNNKWANTGNEKGCIKYLYDHKGNMIQSTSFDSTGKIEKSFKYSYLFDAKKNIVEIKITEEPSIYVMSIICKYDSLGYLLSKSFYKMDLPKSVNSMPNINEEKDAMEGSPPIDDGRYTENYEYNSLHQLIKYEVMHGNITETKNFEYDSLSRLIASKQIYLEKVYYKNTPHDMSKEYWVDSISKTFSGREYIYDKSSGNVIQKKISNKGGNSITKYVYTKTGMFSEINETTNNPLQTKWIKNYYDEQGRKIKTENRAGENNSLYSSSIYSYTNKGAIGWVQKEIIFSATGNSETYRTFDINAKLTEEKGTYTGHTIGDTITTHNTFSKKIAFEYFQ